MVKRTDNDGDTTKPATGTGKDTGQFVDAQSVLPGQAANFPLQIDNQGVTGR